MRRTPLNKISKKQQRRNKDLKNMDTDLLIRANGRCERCKQLPDFRGMHKHHKKHRSQGGKDDMKNIILLCAKCHAAEHGIIEG